MVLISAATKKCFNPRTPAGCDDPRQVAVFIDGQGFNPRTPAGCDLKPSFLRARPLPFQSTHPCGVRRGGGRWHDFDQHVSIHAPLRGATTPQAGRRAAVARFNPRTPAGCDIFSRTPPSPPTRVSIHAPLRGATCGSCTTTSSFEFQSTHPCGVRPFFLPTQTYTHRRFNPRTPAGCDFVLGTTDHLRSSFNPRTPAGCDRHGERTHPGDRQFQSTHPCGVRLRSRPQIHRRMRSFNPRTPAGCDLVLRNRWWLKVLPFQSTHPCGVRPASSAWGSSIPSRFQSTHPCGVRPWSGGHRPRHDRGFNPRTPAGCDFRCCRMGFFH